MLRSQALMLFKLLSAVLLFLDHTPPAAAVECHLFVDHADNGPHLPSVQDCLAIVQHMPAADLPALDNDDTSNPIPSTSAPISPSSFPYFPKAAILHGTCMVVTSYNAEIGFHHLEMATHQALAFRIWGTMRETAGRIVEQCIAQEKEGGEYRALEMPGLQGAWLHVTVSGVDHRYIEPEMKMVLEWGRRLNRNREVRWFDRTFYYV